MYAQGLGEMADVAFGDIDELKPSPLARVGA